MDKKLKLTSKVIDKLIIEKMDYFTHSINLLCEYRENCISCPLQRNTGVLLLLVSEYCV